MSQYDLYFVTGIDQSRISYIEGGYISPGEDEKQKIEDHIGIKINWYDFRTKWIGILAYRKGCKKPPAVQLATRLQNGEPRPAALREVGVPKRGRQEA
jgi:hypothetical protein